MRRARTRKQIYRNRTKRSQCRNKSLKACSSTVGCKVARGRKGSYCRRISNRSIQAINKASLLV